MKESKEIEEYFSECLSPILNSFGVSEEFINKAIANVRMQVYSFCSHWNDIAFRNGLYAIGLEEGLFYEPKSPVNPFVVVSIRNSLLETIQSDDYQKAGLSRCLGNDEIRSITKQAIEYFTSINDDIYGVVARSYPIAWAALVKIGNNASQAISYPQFEFSHNSDAFDHLSADAGPINSFKMVVWDGYSAVIDDALKSQLNGAISYGVPFVVESFKSLSRNFEKLLCVMEYVLYHQGAFVTCNYYITNGYITKRDPLLKPGHTKAETQKNLENLSGIRKTHREVICKVING